MEHTTELRVGNTLFIVTEEFSQTATETVEKKLKKLIDAHAFDNRSVIRNLSKRKNKQLAMYSNQSEYGYYQNQNKEEF